MNDCIFCKIAQKQIPAKILFEDEWVVAFPDINPQREVHILVIPKYHFSSLSDVVVDNREHQLIMGRMLQVADQLAVANGSTGGCRVVINNREIGHQEVKHLHMHILGGKTPVGAMLSKR